MLMNTTFLGDSFSIKWQSRGLAQAGLFYGKDNYDRERYERIREISAEMISYQSEIPPRLCHLFHFNNRKKC